MVTIFNQKKENNVKLKQTLGLLLKYKPLGLIKISNLDIISELVKCLQVLPVGFIIYNEGVDTKVLSKNIIITGDIDDSLLSGFDFVVCDDDIKNINNYIQYGITPIINRDNHISKILSEFDPIKNIGNAYFYENLDHYNIFYAIVRYIENYKFPYDNKNLVKNVLKV